MDRDIEEEDDQLLAEALGSITQEFLPLPPDVHSRDVTPVGPPPGLEEALIVTQEIPVISLTEDPCRVDYGLAPHLNKVIAEFTDVVVASVAAEK